MHTRFLTLIGAAIFVAGFLVFQATKDSAASVLLPSDLMAKAGKRLTRIRVAGKVVEPITYATEPKIELRFKLRNPGVKEIGSREVVTHDAEALIPVVYYNLKPDMFAPGRDVIIDGEYENGVLAASKLLTQCPSKYEPADPAKKYAAPKP